MKTSTKLNLYASIGALVFAINWLFFGALYLLGRWIWDSFYRTPTR